MLSLTRIFLHNWHRFRSELIEVEDSLYFIGHNGSGKSTILDAMQVILLADLHLIKFNSSAQEKSERTIDGFVRGKLSETRWLRPENCLGYILLEFTNQKTNQAITLGCCIEAGPTLGPHGERAYFIMREALHSDFFRTQGRMLTRLELKKLLQRSPKGRYYDVVKEYQSDMLDVLGGLNPRFFNLFQRAMSFKPIANIHDFVEKWLLSEVPLDLLNLQQVISRLNDLQEETKTVKTKIKDLTEIASKRKEYLQAKENHELYSVLLSLLRREQAEWHKQKIENDLQKLETDLQEGEALLQQTHTVLTGARQAKEDELRKYYSLDVVTTQERLRKEIAQKTELANFQKEQKRLLIQQLKDLERPFHLLVRGELLLNEELQQVQQLREEIDTLHQEHPFPAALIPSVDQATKALDQALQRVKNRLFEIEKDAKERRQKAAQLEKEIQEIQTKGASISYPPGVDALRLALEPIIGERPPVLCELLEVPDERWQQAVEAMLGNRRFTIIVLPKHYQAVLHTIEQIKRDSRYHGAGVLDIERAADQKRVAKSQSLALQVNTEYQALTTYIAAVLGNIITCFTAEETRQYDRAITPDLVYYNEWTIRLLPQREYQRWFVGQRARDSQIQARQRDLEELQGEFLALSLRHARVREEEKQVDYGRTLAILRSLLNHPPDDIALRSEIQTLQEELDTLDMNEAQTIEAVIQRLTEVITKEEAVHTHLVKLQGERAGKKESLQEKKREATYTLNEQEQQARETMQHYPDSVEAASAQLLKQREKMDDKHDLTQAMTNTQSTEKRFDTTAGNALSELKRLETAYNITHSFAAVIGMQENDRYAEEQQRLEATELPHFEAQIQQARQETEQELREHVLHNLRERITYARDELKRMNNALKPLEFHGETYQFIWDIASDVREYYHLITDSQVIGVGSLFESNFYAENQEIFDRFYKALTQKEGTTAEKAEQARLMDYRTYLKYDIEVKNRSGDKSRLSSIMGETSGGETQTPFYLAIAASFVQLYRMKDQEKYHHDRPTIRLIVFDEAFNKMDQERIGSTLDMFHRFGLQIVTATPLERCEYLVPKMCTNLVVTRVKDEIMIDDYRNYRAKLEQSYAE